MDSEPLPSNTPPLAENNEELAASPEVKESITSSVAQTSEDAVSLVQQKDGNSFTTGAVEHDALTAPCQRDISLLKNSAWWKNASLFCIYFVPHMVKPSALFLTAISIAVGMLFVAKNVLSQPMQFQQVFMLIGMYLFGIVIVPTIIVFWLTSLLARITAFCLAFQRMPRSQFHSKKIDRDLSRTNMKLAVKEIPKRNGFLARYWGLFTMYMLFPFAVAFVSFLPMVYESYLGQLATSPDYQSSLPPLPFAVTIISSVCCSISALYVTVGSLVGIVLSSCTQLPVAVAVTTTFKFAHKHLWPLLLITVVMMVLGMVISSPQEVLQRIDAKRFMTNDIVVFYLEQVWWSLTGLVIPTITMVPVCEYMRGNRERIID